MNYENIFSSLKEKLYTGIVGLEHGMSVTGEQGFRKVVEAYRRADSMKM
jgi:hydroxypyruvate isomerase